MSDFDWEAETRTIPPLLGDERHGRVPTKEPVEGWMEGTEGYRLKTFRWTAVEKPKALLVILHGYNHYVADVYYRLATELNEEGIAVISLEHQGQGRSEGPPLDVGSFSSFPEDALKLARAVEEELESKVPVFVLGESLGGLIAYNMAQRDPALIRGAILFAPALGLAPEMIPNACVISMMRGMAVFMPQAKLVPVPDHLPRCFSHPRKLEVERHDPHRIPEDRFGLRMAWETYSATLAAQESMPAFRAPFLCFHGEEDTVTNPEFSRKLFREAASTDKTLVTAKECKHVLFYERVDVRKAIFDLVLSWIQRRAQEPNVETNEEVEIPAGKEPWDPVEIVKEKAQDEKE